jgi:hypothetical protein
MKWISISLAAALGMVLLGCEAQTLPSEKHVGTASPAPATPHEQTHDESRPLNETSSQAHQHGDMHSKLRLDQGQPWATDAPLVAGMERIRDAVNEAAALPTLNATSAAALAQSVRGQVDFLIANCRLEPEADATLHVFIGQLLNASGALEKNPASAEGLPQLQETLREYPHYFAHPGWRTESAGEG